MYQDVFRRLANAYSEALNALAELAPIFVIALLLPGVWLIFRKSKLSTGSQVIAAYEVYFFSLVGVAVAYLTQLSKDTVLENALPSALTGLILFFQLLGRYRGESHVPLNARITFASGTFAVISFLISSRYFHLLFGGGGI